MAPPGRLATSHHSKNRKRHKLVVKASVGQGRIAQQPWIVIRNNDITPTTRKGVYIAFLFSKDKDKVYLTLTQGVTDSGSNELSKTKEELTPLIDQELFLIKSKMNEQEKYGDATICAYEWGDNIERNIKAFNYLLDFYMNLAEIRLGLNTHQDTMNVMEPPVQEEVIPSFNTNDIINRIIRSIKQTGLLYDDILVKRLALSLLTKPFVILSGLAGSGKTQLILAFAKTLVDNEDQQICFISVGADWTNREPLLGYPNALKSNEYVRPENGALDLLIECNKENNANKPYFLILDEMNLSVVERYFSDFLSSMESHEKINLWRKSNEEIGNIPESISLPRNLFIIGTINVDETTYMFSPKVLDRASVIEFKVSEEEMSTFLNASPIVNIQNCKAKVSDAASTFVMKAREDIPLNRDANDILRQFFRELKKVNAEFGYRTAFEIGRFITLAREENGLTLEEAIDASIVQKLLPKLHGSRKKVVPVLKELWKLCGCTEIEEMEVPSIESAKYKLAADKILRMYNCAIENGFTSFAEA